MGPKYSQQQGKISAYFNDLYCFLCLIKRIPDSEKVEGEAQGEEDALAKLLKDLDRGPTHAHVVKLEKSDIEVVEGESGFEVRH
jgi:acylphosphatase